jgi:hypothetical protein
MASRHHSSSASTRVGHVLELVTHIISFLDKPGLTRMARVSHAVSAPALAALWFRIDDPWLLFRLLDPSFLGKSALHSTDKAATLESTTVRPTCRLVDVCMLKISDIQPASAFWRTPTSVWAWSRFNSYARLVRKLVYVEEEATPIEVLFWVAITACDATPRPLLPSLSDLTWYPIAWASRLESGTEQLARLGLLAHPGMRKLTLRSIFLNTVDVVFSSVLGLQTSLILHRCPSLTRISLSMSQPASSEAESHIVALIHGLTHLERIHLPGYWGTSSILDALSEKPHLGWGQPDSVADVHLSTSAPVFRDLTHLALCIGFSDMLNLLSGMSAGCLVHLHIALPQPFEDAAELPSFLRRLSEYQPRILELILRLRNLAVESIQTPRLNANDLAPLLLFPKLQLLELYCCQPLALSDAELQELLSGLPRLTTLLLNHEPLDDREHPPYLNQLETLLSLEALNIVSVCCQDMKDLGLFLRYKNIGVFNGQTLRMPEGLLSYNMGTSPLHDNDVEALASLFFDVVPLGCKLRWGYDFPEDSEMIDWEALYDQYGVACVNVNRILVLVSYLRGLCPSYCCLSRCSLVVWWTENSRSK